MSSSSPLTFGEVEMSKSPGDSPLKYPVSRSKSSSSRRSEKKPDSWMLRRREEEDDAVVDNDDGITFSTILKNLGIYIDSYLTCFMPVLLAYTNLGNSFFAFYVCRQIP